jgi:hypothetical protein
MSASDRAVGKGEVPRLLAATERVEEKLDGANVAIWRNPAGGLEVATRGGPDAMDRGGQVGPLRAWLRDHPRQADGVEAGIVVFAEWRWFVHSIVYDRLPSLLIALDMWRPSSGFAPVRARDAWAAATGWVVPPLLHEGPVAELDDLDRWTERSHCRDGSAEGAVLRLDGDPRAVKWVRPDFRRMEGWSRPRPRNREHPPRGGRNPPIITG